MTQAIITALIAGFCSIVSAAVAALIQKNGWAFWKPATTIRCIGSAQEIHAIRSDGTIDSNHRGYSYDIRDAQLIIRGQRVSLTALLTTTDGEVRVSDGRVTGEGRVHNGVAYLIYSVKDDPRHQAWSGTIVLRLPGLGVLSGYWLTEDHVEAGVLAFGRIDLQRA